MSDAFLESGGLLPTPGSGVDFGFESRFSKLSLGQPRPGGSTTAQLTPEKQQALKDQLEKPSKVPSRLTMLLKQFRRRVRVWKRSYFNFVTGLLAESNGSVAAIVVSAVEFLQMIALCFHDIDWGPHGNAFGSAIEFSLIEEPVVERHGYLYSYILVGIYLFYIYVFAVLGAYLLKSHVNNNFNIGLWPMRALRIKTFMADSVLFIPITFTFFNLYECQWGDCSTSKQIEILLAVICTPALFIHFAGAYLNAFTVYQSNPVSLDVEARSESFVKVLQITQRLFVVAAFVYSNYIPIFKSTTSLIFAVIMSSYLVVFIPYYSRLFNILSFIFSNVIAWASLFGVVQQVYVFIQPDHNHAAQDYIFYAFLASIPLIAVGSYYIFQQRYIFATSFKTASDNFGVAEASKNNFNTWEIEEIEVTKKKDARFWHPSQVELATRFLIENSDPQAVDLAEQIFLAGVQKFPNSSWLMLQYSIYFLVFKKDKSMALNYISKAKARGLPLTLQVLAYMQRQDSRYTNAMNKKVATVDRVEFKQLMKAAANNHRDAKASIANFWQTILQAEEDKPVDTSILINLVAQMERCDDRATVAYRQILQKFPLSVRVLQSYAVFLDEIHNNLIEAEEVRKKIKKIQDAGMSDEFVGAGDVKTGVLTVKTKKERQGYKEYRKQVYLYSRANSMMMHSMIRAVLLLFVIVGICQLLIIQIGLSTIRNEIHWLHTLDQCSDSFPIIHTTLRSIQASNPFPSPESLNASTASVQKLLTGISENTTLLFDRLSNRRSTYVMWGQPRVMVDLFHGDVLSPNRSTLMLSLRDATLLYLRHSKASVEAVTAVGADPTVVFGSNAWRFVLDNGMVVLANAFTDVSRIIAHDIRFNLQLLGYAELAVWGFGILTILLSAFFVFAPMINKARRERETSLRAFLQIPKSVTTTLFARYYEPGAVSKDDLTQAQESVAEKSDTERDTDDEGPVDPTDPNAGDVDVLHTKAMTGYLRLTLMYSRALLLIAAAFSVALSGDFLISLNLVPYPGIVMSGMDAQFKTLRMVAVVNDRYQGVLAASEGVSVRPALRPTFSFWDEARPWASAYHVMTSDMNSIESSQRNILYGNESLGIPLKPLNNAYNRYFFEPKATGDKRSLFERVSMFVDSAIRIALTDLGNAGLVLTDVRSVFGSAPSIAEEYRMFIDAYQSDIERQISQLYDLSIGMFVLVVCAILGTYFFYWRPILSYLINTENERTLKLLLMIPVEIVADIDSLRELLHLRQSTRIVNPVQQNQGPSSHNQSVPGLPPSRMDSEVSGHNSHYVRPHQHPVHHHGFSTTRGSIDPHDSHQHNFTSNDSGEIDGVRGAHGASIDGDHVPATVAEALSMTASARKRSSMMGMVNMQGGGVRRSFIMGEYNKSRLSRAEGAGFEFKEGVNEEDFMVMRDGGGGPTTQVE